MIASGFAVRGKSEHHGAGCWVTPSGSDSKESATENIPPKLSGDGKGEKVR